MPTASSGWKTAGCTCGSRDLLAGAPAPVMEALAHILLGKLYRKPIAAHVHHRYRLYLNRRDVRRQAQLVRQIRGRKFISGPQGEHYNLDEIFERLNRAIFRRTDGASATGLEPAARRAACWGTSIPRTTPSSSAGFSTRRRVPVAGAGIRDVPRDAAPAVSGGSHRRAAAGAHAGIPGGGEEIPAA